MNITEEPCPTCDEYLLDNGTGLECDHCGWEMSAKERAEALYFLAGTGFEVPYLLTKAQTQYREALDALADG